MYTWVISLAFLNSGSWRWADAFILTYLPSLISLIISTLFLGYSNLFTKYEVKYVFFFSHLPKTKHRTHSSVWPAYKATWIGTDARLGAMIPAPGGRGCQISMSPGKFQDG